MPVKSEKQRRFMRMCKHNRGKSILGCPPKSVVEEFLRSEKPKKGKKK